MTKDVTSKTPGKEFFDLVQRAERDRERTILYRDGKPIAAIVPADDAEYLEELEDRIDIEEAKKALAEPGTIPWEEVKKKLGL